MIRRLVACGLLLTLSLTSFGDDKPGAKLPAATHQRGLGEDEKAGGNLADRRPGR